MKLFVSEIQTVLRQKIVVRSKNLQTVYVRAHLYRHLNPTGNLTLELENAAGQLIATGNTVPISSIPATLDYFHGYIRFELSHQLKAGSEYFLAIRAGGGYSYSPTAFIGWVNDFDLRHVRTAYAPDGGVAAPRGLEIWGQEYLTRRGL